MTTHLPLNSLLIGLDRFARTTARTLLLLSAMIAGAHPAIAAQFPVSGPVGSGGFGTRATWLANGHFVVVDPGFDESETLSDIGAVYLYSPSGNLISTLKGSNAGDRIGEGGLKPLSNGNVVVISPYWKNPDVAGLWHGAITLINGYTGLNGRLSAINSIVGRTSSDMENSVRFGGTITELPGRNGNFVLALPDYDVNSIQNAGAVALVNGSTGQVIAPPNAIGPPTGLHPGNALVGGSFAATIGQRILALPNGNYVTWSLNWNGARGAVSFGRGDGPTVGVVSDQNALTGNSPGDYLGSDGVFAFPNSDFAVLSSNWDNTEVSPSAIDAGALTLGDGETGFAAVGNIITSGNSLVGGASGDGRLPQSNPGMTFTPLSNGNAVVVWLYHNNRNGAVSFINAINPPLGQVSLDNSMLWILANEQSTTNFIRITPLNNGNFIISRSGYDYLDLGNSVLYTNAGWVSWGSGTTGVSGFANHSQALVGQSNDDFVGMTVAALANGHAVVGSPYWNDGATQVDAGAATWLNGTQAVSVNSISAANSWIGRGGNKVGIAIMPLPVNNNYVVQSPLWEPEGMAVEENRGAATWVAGNAPSNGVVSAANSLTGTKTNDFVTSTDDIDYKALPNGDYLIRSAYWNNGTATEAGAATWCNGSNGICRGQVGRGAEVSVSNSLVGDHSQQLLGDDGADPTEPAFLLAGVAPPTHKPIPSAWFDPTQPLTPSQGAVSFVPINGGLAGTVNASNSLIGQGVPENTIGQWLVDHRTNGHFIAQHSTYDNNKGAIAFALSNGSTVGIPTTDNTVFGLSFACQVERHSVAKGSQLCLRDYQTDDTRNQLLVQMPEDNRVVIHRPGLATTINSLTDAPDPSGNQPVLLTAVVTASSAPQDGRVRIFAESGESCTSNSAFNRDAQNAWHQCSITFTSSGVKTLRAEYLGSVQHAYSQSAPITHTSGASTLFANGFE